MQLVTKMAEMPVGLSTDSQRVASALAGEPEALRGVIEQLTPVIQVRVARALGRWRTHARGRRIEQEIEDLVQEVFVALFESDGRVLRRWDSSRGASLNNFVGLVAEREAGCILRSGKRTPWREDPTESEALDSIGSDEGQICSRNYLRAVLVGVRAELSVRGLEVFECLYVQQSSIAEAGKTLGMSADALYAWRTRLTRLAREVSQGLDGEGNARSVAS